MALNLDKAIELDFPKSSTLYSQLENFDYWDSFAIGVDPNVELQPEILVKAFFDTTPGWVKLLLGIRNAIVGVMGLKTSGPDAAKKSLSDFKFEVGESIGLFRILEKSDNEILFGEDDKHLNFQISLLKGEDAVSQIVYLSTVVKFNNIFGKIYFLPVKPFHKLIVPRMLRRMCKSLKTY